MDGTQRVEAPDGRTIAWSELGAPDGMPVLWCHGGLSARNDAELVAGAAARADVRLLTVDRPGIGDSDRDAGRTVASWAKDAALVLDAAAVDRVSVIGWSAGGPHALAVGAALPERVGAIATIGGMEPLPDKAARHELGLRIDKILIPLARRTPRLAALALRVGHPRRATAAKRQLVRSLSASDRRMLEPVEPEQIAALFDRATQHGPHGVVDDYRAFGSPDWGFTVDRVTAPVRVWQGGDDTAVPPVIGRRLAAALPHGSLRIVPNAGHFLFLEHGPAVFEALRSDLGA